MSVSPANQEGWTVLNRTRNKNNLLHVGYDPRFPNLKVLKKCRSHLAVMGTPGLNGEHFLWPEEAVFLAENCIALITKKDNIPMTLQEAYLILQEKHVPFYKYVAYAMLKRCGFAVVRPRKRDNLEVKKDTVQTEENNGELKKVDRETQVLLNCFPSLDNGELHMPQLHKSGKLVPAECQTMPNLNVLQVNKTGRNTKPCRPPYWPSLDSASTSSTWGEYSKRKREILEKVKKSPKRKEPGTDSLSIDFEVYRTQIYSYTGTIDPLFRIKCFSSREAFNYSNALHDLAETNVIFSIFEQGLVGFINTSGNSIDITCL